MLKKVMCSDDKTTQRLYNKCYTGQEGSCVAILL